tara:strand:+ start:6097 stop:7413 length:1317 start_codon:yes stop_codon:yes gene_type:complete
MNSNARFLSVKIQNRFEKKKEKLSIVRNKIFSQFKPDLISKSRSMILTSEIIRLKDRLDLFIEYITGKKLKYLDPSLHSILRIGYFEILYDQNIPNYAAVNSAVSLTKSILNRKASGFTNAALRNLIRTIERKTEWERQLRKDPRWYSLPNWLYEKWTDRFGKKEFDKLAKAFDRAPNTYIRVDISQKELIDIQKELAESDIKTDKFFNTFLKVKSGSGKILSTELFKTGQISIQDPAAGAVVDFLDPQPGDTVLDVCAAPGTKSLYIAEKVGDLGKVLATDFDNKRVNFGKNDLNRHNRSNIIWSLKDARKDEFPKSDKILIDAPCSGTGVLGRKPDIRWRRKLQDIKNLAKLQFQILEHMANYLHSGGILVYATCSLEPEENWNVIKDFLNLNADFQLIPGPSSLPKAWINEKGCFQTLPHVHGVDGMFSAKIKRL